MHSQRQRLGRIAVWLLVATWAMLGLGAFVIPRMETAFREIDAGLPDLTETVLRMSHWLAGEGEGASRIAGFTILTPLLAAAGIGLVAWTRVHETTPLTPAAAGHEPAKPSKILSAMTMGLWALTAVLIVAGLVIIVALGLPLLRVVSP